MKPSHHPIRSTRRLAPAIAVALLLGGCSSWGGDPSQWSWPGTQPKAAAPTTTAPAVAPPPPKPQAAARPVKPAEPRVTAPAVVKAPPQSEKAPPPKLVGLSEDETAELLGRPAEEAEQPPGKVWTYHVNGCQLAVHLFPDMDRGGFYTLDYTAGEAPKDWCLNRVANEAHHKG
jgi:hypothetical protein